MRTALERNFLSYLRTALAFGNVGVIIAQLFRLQPGSGSGTGLSFYAAGPALAGLFIGGSILLTMFGSWRFWGQQHALARGRVQAGGWEIWCTMGVCTAVSVVRPRGTWRSPVG